MNTDLKSPQTEAQMGLPFLVEMGLAEKCPHCEVAKELVERLHKQNHKLSGVADVWVGGEERKLYDATFSLKNLAVRCSECKDTGVVPTPRGWRVIGLVKMFIDQATGSELGRQEEIPW